MTTTYKVLGQSNPAAATPANLYTVPAATSAVCSTLTVCNQAAVPVTYRIAVRPAGAGLSSVHYLAYDAVLPANDMTALTLGITLAATDIVTVYSSVSTTSFSLFGSELT